MYKVGLTGGIGSGKSTLAHFWDEMGAYVLDADSFAKQLMVEDEDLIADIKSAFGEQAYHNDGSLNKEYLIKESFEKDRIGELNKLVHPVVIERTKQKIEEVEQQGYDVFVKEAALLLQNGRPENLDKIILILAEEEKRIERVKQRSGETEKEIKNRMDKQQNFDELQSEADFVIHNNGSVENLKMRAEILYQKFVERA